LLIGRNNYKLSGNQIVVAVVSSLKGIFQRQKAPIKFKLYRIYVTKFMTSRCTLRNTYVKSL